MQVIPNAVSPSLLHALWACWPDKSWRGWHHYNNRDSNKYASKSRKEFPSPVMPCVQQMIEALSDKVIYGSFPDLEFYGAGLHMIPTGGYLRRHLDSAVMESTGWKREYSCVLCVNPVWEDDWGGEFCLSGEEPVSPEFNQLIVFRTTEQSQHWVNPVVGPVPRCTLSIFYWSQFQPDSDRTSAHFFHDYLSHGT